MERIDTIELLDEQPVVQKEEEKNWKQVLEDIRTETKNFSVEQMCELCIEKQLKESGGITISCTGLTTYKNKVTREYGEDVYDVLKETANAEVLDLAEQLENSDFWISRNIKNTKLFTSRPHQSMITQCSAKKKVLRMGRRCVASNTQIKGLSKNYSIKHLYNLFKKEKRLPEILAFDEQTSKLVSTNKYIIIPNGIEATYKIVLTNGFSVSVTGEHPLVVFNHKHYHFKEAKDISTDDYIVTDENYFIKVKSVELQKPEFTYHVSVLKYQTFITNGGFIHHNTGKCLTLNTKIPTPNGWTTMGDIKVGDQVFGVDGKPYNVTFATDPMYDKDCYEITFNDGTKVECDYSHLWNVTTVSSRRFDNYNQRSHREFTITTEDLFKDFDKKIYGIKLTKPVEYEEKNLLVHPYVLGYWLGDGSVGSGSFTIGDDDSEETINRFAEKGYVLEKKKTRLHHSVKGLITNLKAIGVGTSKKIPKEYLQASVEQRFELLKGLLDSDGGINQRDRDIEFSTCFENLGYEIYELICSLGIKATINKNKSYLYGENKKDRYRILFKTNYEVFHLKRKLEKQILKIEDKVKSRYNIRFIKDIKRIESKPVKCISVDSPDNLFLITDSFIPTHNTYSMAVGMLHRLITKKDYKVLMVAPMATMIDEVVEQIKKFCENLPDNPIISSTASPIAFMEFNTGSTFKGITAGASGAKGVRGKAANLLYVDECFPGTTKIKMANGVNKCIEDVEPGDYVISFCEKTNKIVTKKVLLKKCTGRKEVYEFKTVSGKKLSCTNNHPFWTREGWKEACEATNIATVNTKVGDYFFESIVGSRFKSIEKVYNLEIEDTHTYIADSFIVHNCDFLNSKDLNSILGILMDSPDTEFWASSTPIGEHNLFKLSKDPEFKEFHFPSYVIPHYDDKMDRTLRSQMTETGYIQEVLGLFSASDAGVFQIKFIEQATVREDLIFNEEYVLENRNDFILIIGVDWNHDKVGTRVVIVGYHKISGRYFILSKDKVAREGWTQLDAVQKIVDLNRKYNVDHVYVDEGFGTSQASLLRQFSQNQYGKVPHNHPDLTLTDTVAVNFSSTLVLRDPTTGEELRKQTKQYIVEHAADLLARGVIVLQAEKDNDIIQQMKNYVVKAITARGLKTFSYRDSQIADHDLDAFMIALHGFHQEYSEFSNNSSLAGIGSILSNRSDDYYDDYGKNDRIETIDVSANLIINTRRSIVQNRFNRERNSSFKQRKRW